MNRTCCKKSFAVGLGLLLVSVGLLPVAEAGTWGVKRDWSKVQSVPVGTLTTVKLYGDRYPKGSREITGQFKSATPEAVTLLLFDGKSRTLRKQDVHQVLVYRPLKKRYQGWLAMGIAACFLQTMMIKAGDAPGPTQLILHGIFVPATGAIAFLAAPKMGGIYTMPIWARDAARKTPSRQGWVTPADLRKAGSRLGDEASPGRLWLQAREARIRDGILLDSSTPAGIASLAKHGQPPHLVARGRRTRLKNREGSYGSQSLAQVTQHRNDEGPQAEDHSEQHGQEGVEGSGGRLAR